MSADGKIDITDVEADLLERAYKLCVNMVKRMGPNGHHLGAFYSQAIAVWLSAFQGGDDGETLKDMVKKVRVIFV